MNACDRSQTDTSDEDLLALWSAGDEHALAVLLDRHRRWCVRFANRLVHNQADAEEIAQEALMKLVKQQGQALENLKAWLTTIIRNLSRDFIRSRKRREILYERARREHRKEQDRVRVTRDFEAFIEAIEGRTVTLLGELPEILRDPLALWLQERTHVDVAKELAIPPGTASARIRSALGLLREYLGACGVVFTASNASRFLATLEDLEDPELTKTEGVVLRALERAGGGGLVSVVRTWIAGISREDQDAALLALEQHGIVGFVTRGDPTREDTTTLVLNHPESHVLLVPSRWSGGRLLSERIRARARHEQRR